MKGTIIKLVRGIYYVDTEIGVIKCKARGLFREKDISPVVGDKVEIRISSEDQTGYIETVYPRKTELIRPAVANIDRALIVFSIKQPELNTYLLDKNLIMTNYFGIDSSICFTKSDLDSDEILNRYVEMYRNIGYTVYVVGKTDYSDLESIKESLVGRITSVSGPSGVGKSTLINKINPDINLKTSSVSLKTERGRHTTRHVELIPLEKDSYIIDTPGFSSLGLDFILDERDLSDYFIEFNQYADKCKFLDCMHINEPECAVKEEIGNSIYQSRYDSYILFINEIKKNRRY
ncbi:ribosome small subunit-dependent GTPase A [Microaceticoccus formicicus]|uniref:ribosome small subunit-dependent GTPase A n=1 Tax=Microaceticoccus formicicus TaxID=3118105 RepID=UPI003CCFFCF9|nr:ribosome small subunit-dependent GTPase A [Peptoniphilaceae bacterium AMB_02]